MAKKRGMARHPVQPLITEEGGIIRFKPNRIVKHLIAIAPPMYLNKMACMEFSDEDWTQFSQLIGYSLSGFGELSYVDNKTYSAAAAQDVYGKQS